MTKKAFFALVFLLALVSFVAADTKGEAYWT